MKELQFKGTIILNSATITAIDLAAYKHKPTVTLFGKPVKPERLLKLIEGLLSPEF